MHPATESLLRWFNSDHLQPGYPKLVFEKCTLLAHDVVDMLPDDPELSAGLRKLIEAKDCFVRAAVRTVEAEKKTA